MINNSCLRAGIDGAVTESANMYVDNEETEIEEYAVVSPDGKLTIYGNQQWVKDGRAAAASCGKTVKRTVTIIYGDWEWLED